MFTYHTQIRLRSTDATGVLYFAEQFTLAMEAFEAFLKERGIVWKEWMASNYVFPVVHAEADYCAPLAVGDEVSISVTVEKVGSSSASLCYCFQKIQESSEVGRVQIVHVAVDKKTQAAIPIPQFLREILEPELAEERG